MARNFHFEYGTARAWGSFGYAIGAFFAGIFFSISPHINFWLVSLFGAVFMMINMCFKDKDHQCVAADAGGVKKRILSQFSRIETSGFSSYLLLGRGLSITFLINNFSCLLCRFIRITRCRNAPVWLSQLIPGGTRSAVHGDYSVLCESGRAKNALLIGVVIMALRILSCALFVNPWIISLVKLLHAIEVPLCVISVFKYSVANFDKRLSSTIFLIGFQIASSLGIVLLSTPTGILFDHAGYQTVFFAISGIVCLMLLFGIFFLSKKREQIVMETPVPSAI